MTVSHSKHTTYDILKQFTSNTDINKITAIFQLDHKTSCQFVFPVLSTQRVLVSVVQSTHMYLYSMYIAYCMLRVT